MGHPEGGSLLSRLLENSMPDLNLAMVLLQVGLETSRRALPPLLCIPFCKDLEKTLSGGARIAKSHDNLTAGIFPGTVITEGYWMVLKYQPGVLEIWMQLLELSKMSCNPGEVA